jgi:hypothetical protein
VFEKIKAFHQYSCTVGLAHAMTWLGLGMEALAEFPDVASSVGLQAVVPPAYLGHYTLVIAGLTLAARMRHHVIPDKGGPTDTPPEKV